MTNVEVLQRAKGILMERGWRKGGFRDDAGNTFCAVGAVYEAYGFEWFQEEDTEGGWDCIGPASTEAQAYLTQVLEQRGATVGYVAIFNDLPETTFNDVIDLYDDAILLAKQAESANA